jgi:hypothetical protein
LLSRGYRCDRVHCCTLFNRTTKVNDGCER